MHCPALSVLHFAVRRAGPPSIHACMHRDFLHAHAAPCWAPCFTRMLCCLVLGPMRASMQDNVPPGSLGDLAPDRDMTFEEKRKLSAHMASIPGEKLAAVLDIVYEGEVRVRGVRVLWKGRVGEVVCE